MILNNKIAYFSFIVQFLFGTSFIQEFKKNVSKTNGGKDFDEDMLEDVYNAIRSVVVFSFFLPVLYHCILRK